ncbi:MAG: glycosyltransferase family 39 protein, partial [Leptolyngbyaceae bacterium]|nr:glycosyltransferase family 39 protein [Leptolyngbyaceae bacterium]
MSNSTVSLNKKLLQPISSLHRLTLFCLGFGALIRIIQYASNRSLWADEAKIALNIIQLSYREFLQPLPYEQAAPPGFLFVEKLIVQLFGNSEYSLRLFPLIASLVSLILFYLISRYYLNRIDSLIANALFACNQYLVYYASEVKQYSSDVAINLFVFLTLVVFRPEKLTFPRAVAIGLVGAIALWFSHPVVFVLAGVEGTRLIVDLINYNKRHQSDWMNRLLMYGCWLVSFAIFYSVTLTDIRNNQFLPFTWDNEFPEHPLDLFWFLEAFRSFFYKPLAFPPVISELAIILFVWGAIWLFQNRRNHALYLTTPIGLTLLAGYLNQYPFDNRLILFLLPYWIVLLIFGMRQCLNIAYIQRSFFRYVLIVAVLGFPIIEGGLFLVQPHRHEHIKPVMQYVQENRKPGDIVYVFQKSRFQFRYYASRFGFQPDDYQIGSDLDDTLQRNFTEREERIAYRKNINQLKGNDRVWLIFSDTRLREDTEFILEHLD